MTALALLRSESYLLSVMNRMHLSLQSKSEEKQIVINSNSDKHGKHVFFKIFSD